MLFYVLLLLFLGVLIVNPYRRTESFRITPAKIAALVYVFGMYLYHRDIQILLVALWPISFIWFPEFWGKYRGLFQSSVITEKTPPAVVSIAGWFFLLALPLIILWRL